MEFDILLPIVIFVIVVTSVFSYQKFEKKVKSLFEEKQFSTRDAVLLVISMGVMVTAITFIPSLAIQLLYMGTYSYMLFFFTYIALKRWYIAILPPIIFILSYFLFWNIFLFNLFAALFAVIITVYLGGLFSWKTTWVFAVFLTMMDIFQVFVTGFMGESAGKVLELRLPVVVLFPTYPRVGMMGLGLGDIFFSGLLAVQTMLKHGWKAGILSAITISIAMFVFEVTLFNVALFEFFPATVVVILGWATAIGIMRLIDFSPKQLQGIAEKPQK